MPPRIFFAVLLLLQCSAVMPDRASGRSLLLGESDEASFFPLAEFAGASLIGRVIQERTVAEPLLCGSNEIRGILQVDEDFDVHRVMAIRFQDAIDHANAFVTKQRTSQEGIVQKLKGLEEEWYRSSGAALSGEKDLSDQEITDLMKKVISEAYGSAEVAAKDDCLPPADDHSGEEPYTLAQQKLKHEQEELLKAGKSIPGNWGNVKQLCQGAVGASTANCDKLCDALAAIAVAPSSGAMEAASKGKPSLGELTRKIKATTDELQKVLDDVHDCEATREGLMSYKLQVDKVTEEHGSNGRQSRDVQMQLDVVMKCIEQFGSAVQQEEKLRQDLDVIMTKSKGEEQKLTAEVDKNRHDALVIETQVNDTRRAVEEVKAVVQDSQKVVAAIHDFKAAIVVTMQSFIQVYNDTIRQPLGELSKLAGRMTEDVWPTVADPANALWKVPKDGAGKLSAQCRAVAEATGKLCADERPEGGDAPAPADSKMQAVCRAKEVLMADCQAKLEGDKYVDDMRDIMGREQEKVKTLTFLLKTELEHVLELANGQKEGKADGEPDYLRRFTTILKDSKLYQDHVVNWKAGSPEDGAMLKMAKMLDGVAAAIEKKAAAADGKLKEINDRWLAAVAEGTMLQDQLKNISATMLDQQAKHTDLESKLQEHQKRLDEAHANQARYQQQLDTMKSGLGGLTNSLKKVFDDLKAAAHAAFAAGHHEASFERPAVGSASLPSTTLPSSTSLANF